MSILFIVATPIGNLADLSPRAQHTLSSVDFILCEDTRHTRGLLQHFGIHKPLESLHEHNERAKIQSVLDNIQHNKQQAALVSDAGLPAICDPGSYLVAAAHQRQIPVIVIPGPSSPLAAVAASGFRQPRVVFSGFLPRTKGEQEREFAVWFGAAPCIAVCFESPKRLLASLQHLLAFIQATYGLSDIPVCFSREISKQFEEHRADALTAVIANWADKPVLGECVLSIDIEAPPKNPESLGLAELAQKALTHSKTTHTPLKAVCKEFAERYGLVAKDIYNAVLSLEKDRESS